MYVKADRSLPVESFNDRLNLCSFTDALIAASDLPATRESILRAFLRGTVCVIRTQGKEKHYTDNQCAEYIRQLMSTDAKSPTSATSKAISAMVCRPDAQTRRILEQNCRELCRSISDIRVFLEESVIRNLSLRFFTAADRTRFSELAAKPESHALLFYEIFRHGFSTLDNLPPAYSKRQQALALTYDIDQPVRYTLLESISSASEIAAIDAGSFWDEREEHVRSFDLFLRAAKNPTGLWHLSKRIRNKAKNAYSGDIPTAEQVNALRVRMAYRFAQFDFGDLDRCIVQETKTQKLSYLAFKINYMLALGDDHMCKAYSTLAIMLNNREILFRDRDEQDRALLYSLAEDGRICFVPSGGEGNAASFTRECINAYNRYSVVRGDPLSMLNTCTDMVNRYVEGEAFTEEERELMYELAHLTASLGLYISVYNEARLIWHESGGDLSVSEMAQMRDDLVRVHPLIGYPRSRVDRGITELVDILNERLAAQGDLSASTIPAPRPAGQKFCRFCGREIPADSVFCEYCGSRLSP